MSCSKSAPNGQLRRVFESIKAVNLKLPAKMVQNLATNPSVAHISPDRTNQGALDIPTQTVYANIAWSYGWADTGVGVGVT